MALVKRGDVWDPFRDWPVLTQEMNRLFERPLARWWPTGAEGQWLPEVDIVDQKDQILVKADLPGIKKEDFEVEVADGVLTIKGERKEETERKNGKTYRLERSYGSFLRSFALPAGVDESKVNASYKDGVLEITIPKLSGARAKQVKVDVK